MDCKKGIFFVLILCMQQFYLPATIAAPTIADYGALPTISMMEISPSGDLIAFRKVEGDSDLLVVYSLTEKKTLYANDVSAISPRNLYFISDNELVIVAAEYRRLAGFNDFREQSTAFRLDLKKKEIDQLLTPGHKIVVSQTGLGGIVGISPDKKYIYIPAFTTVKADRGETQLSLMRVNLQKPVYLKPVEDGESDTIDYFMNQNSEIIAQERFLNKSDKHIILAADKGSFKTIYEQTTPIRTIDVIGVTQDAKSLVVLKEGTDNDRRDYFLMSLEDGKLSSTDFGREDADIEAVIVNINRVVLGVKYAGFTSSYRFFDKDINAFWQKLAARFPEHSVSLSSFTPDWSKVIVVVEGSQFAGDYYLFDRQLNATFLGTQRPNIKPENINPIAKFSYAASDGLTIPALLTIPRDKVDKLQNLPTIIYPHGGPRAYDRIGFDWIAQSLASQGYLVVQPQFRGSEGFGADFIRAGNGEWGKKMQSDITDGVNYLIKKGYVDPKRICIVGASYGGYAALAGGAFTPVLYKCVVSIAGVSDLPNMLRQSKFDFGRDHWVVSYWEKAMADGNATNATLDAVSPVNFAKDFTAPVLLIHGERDKVVPIAQSKAMESALRKAKKSVELTELDGENHYLQQGETRLQTAEAVINFVNKHIGDSAAPWSDLASPWYSTTTNLAYFHRATIIVL